MLRGLRGDVVRPMGVAVSGVGVRSIVELVVCPELIAIVDAAQNVMKTPAASRKWCSHTAGDYYGHES